MRIEKIYRMNIIKILSDVDSPIVKFNLISILVFLKHSNKKKIRAIFWLFVNNQANS